jgi:hypothetical protein
MLFKDRVDKIKSFFSFNINKTFKEDLISLKGKLFFKVYESSTGKLIYNYESPNIIVNTASILLARLLKNNTEPQKGISYLAIGSGNPSWDLFNPPAPTTSQTRLENEFFRKAIDYSTFIHPQTGEPTNSYTNIVDYVVTLGESEAIGPIVEFGLFGGDATDELNSGTMINWRTVPVITKTIDMVSTIIFRIKT